MTTLWDKLSLKEGQEIMVVNAPKSFAAGTQNASAGRAQQRMSNQGADVCAGLPPALADRQIAMSGET
jgi:hypothetical protein